MPLLKTAKIKKAAAWGEKDLEAAADILLKRLEVFKGDYSLDAILAYLGQEFAKTGINLLVSIIDGKRENFIIRHWSRAELLSDQPASLAGLETILKINSRLPLERLNKYRLVFEEQTALFSRNHFKEIVAKLSPLARKLRNLPETNSIIVPLILKGEVIGCIEFFAPDLSGDHLTALNKFCHSLVNNIASAILFQEVKKSKERYHDLFASAGEGFLIFDASAGRFIEANNKMTEISGYTAEEFKQLHYLRLFDREERDQIQSLIRRPAADQPEPGQALENYETKLITKNGDQRIINLTINQTVNSGEWFFIINDISQRRRAEQALYLSEQKKFGELFNKANDAVFLIDLREDNKLGNFIEVNEVARRRLGYTKQEFSKMSPYDITAKESLSKVGKLLTKFNQRGSLIFETIHLAKNGRKIPVEISAHAFTLNHKKVILSIARDIGKRKKTARLLKEKEEFSSSLLAFAPNPILVANQDASIRYVNPALEKLTGYTAEELIGRRPPYPWWPGAEVETDKKDLAEAFVRGARELEKQFQKKNGERFWVKISSTPLKKIGEDIYYLANWTEITKKKQLEEKLRSANEQLENKVRERTAELIASREKINNILNSSPDAITVTDLMGNIIECNQAAVTMHGFRSKQQLIGLNRTELIAAKDQPKATDNLTRTLKQGAVEDIEYSLVTSQGEEFPALLSTSLVRDAEGQPIAIVANTKNIIERKRAEEALRASEHRYKQLWDKAPVAYHTLDSRGVIRQVNKKEEELLGYTAAEMIGRPIFDFILASQRAEAKKRFRKKISGQLVPKKNNRIYVRKDGRQICVAIDDALEYDQQGRVSGIRTTMIDVSKSRQDEDELKKIQVRLNKAQQFAHLGNWDWDIERNILWWSDEIYRIFGLKPQEFGATYEAFLNSVHPDDREQVKQAVNLALTRKKPYSINHRIILPNGSQKIVHEQAKIFYNKQGKAMKMLGTVQDITKQRQAEEDLRRLAAVVRNSNDAIIVRDFGGKIMVWNQAAVKIFGYSKADARQMNINRIIPEQKRNETSAVIAELSQGKKVESYETQRLTKDGRILDIHATVFALVDNQGSPTAIVTMARDITERKEAERRLQATNTLLKFLSEKTSRQEYLDVVARQIRDWTGCHYVGIRMLDQQGRVPYESYLGFSREFWQTENWLVLNRHQCACTRVIAGQAEPQDKPMMTSFGSFSCGNTFKFIDNLSAQEKERFRGECLKNGFATVVVIPVKYGGKILGAIHLADEAVNKMTPKAVESIESITPIIGEAINKFSVGDQLKQSESRFRNIFETAAVSLWEIDFSAIKAEIDKVKSGGQADLRQYLKQYPDFIFKTLSLMKVIDVNNHTLKLFGADNKKQLTESLIKFFTPETLKTFSQTIIAAADNQSYFEAETKIKILTGERRDVLVTASLPVKEAKYENILLSMVDVSEFKKAEQEIKRNSQVQTTLNRLLRLSLADISLEAILGQVLDNLLVIPWLKLEPRGGVWLASANPGKLILTAQRGLGQKPLDQPAVITQGTCHCGRAVKEDLGDIVISHPAESASGNKNEASGHYCIPIKAGSKNLGQLNLYIKPGESYHKKEINFLTSVAGVVASMIERKQLQDKIKQARDHYEQVIDTIDDAICVINREYQVVSCNKTFAEQVGRRINQIKGQDCQEVLSHYRKNIFNGTANDYFGERGIFQKVFNQDKIQRLLEKSLDQSGRVYYHRVNIYPIKNKQGVIGQLVLSARDTTAVQSVQEEIRQLHEFNQRILDNVAVSIIVLNRDGTIISLNEQAKKMMNKRSSRAVGRKLINTKSIADQADLVKLYQLLLSRGQSFHYNNLAYRPEGSQREKYLDIIAVPLFSEAGQVDGAISMALDHTEEMLAKQALEDLNRDLEKKVYQRTVQVDKINKELQKVLELKSKFIADASHELRTPLTIMQGNLELTIRECQFNKKDEPEAYNLINKEIKLMANILADLSLLTNADSGSETISYEKVNLNELILSVSQSLKLLAGKKQITINALINKNRNPEIMGDETKLEKLLLNITRNAIKYNKPGGWIKIGVDKTGREARLYVADSGIGIPQEEIPYIFERFYRVDKARSRGEGGSGLGLSICKWIAESHGGRITVESELGQGSKFVVHLPYDYKKQQGELSLF